MIPSFVKDFSTIQLLIYLDGLESYFELSDALEEQSLFRLVVNKIAVLYEDFEESVLRHISEALNKKKEGSSEIDKHKARYNFASINGGAKIIQTKPSVKLGKSILDDAIDKYLLENCSNKIDKNIVMLFMIAD